MSSVVLFVNGQKYAGWKTVQITKNLQAVSAGFSLSVSDNASRNAKSEFILSIPIYPGDACAIELDDQRIITGYVDKVSPSFDSSQHGLSITGRDKAADLVDCSIFNTPGEFKQLTLDRIVSILCKPFGIAVKVETDVGAPIEVFSTQPGESVWEAIERAMRLRGVLVVSNGLGDVVIMQGADNKENNRAATALIQGENILSASAEFNHSDRFSLYKVQATAPWSDDLPAELANAIEGEAKDKNVLRYRPKIIKAEAAGSTAQAQTRAQWEAVVRAGRSGTYQITTPGWTQVNGELWSVNTLVPVKSNGLSVEGDLLITGVTFSKNNQTGTTTQLTLMRPDAFEPKPEIPASTDPWNLLA